VTGISKNTVHETISDLNFCKVSSCWVLKILTEEHRNKRMAASLGNFCCYQDEGESFMERWVYGFTTESKRNSMTWKHPHSPTMKIKINIEPSLKKSNDDHVLEL
jgi:hypothetical protein